jgi:hypothetical protein
MKNSTAAPPATEDERSRTTVLDSQPPDEFPGATLGADAEEGFDPDAFYRTMHSIAMPVNLRDAWARICAALMSKAPQLMVPANRARIQVAFQEVSEMLNDGRIDAAEGVGLLVTRVIDHCSETSSDFEREERIRIYRASQRPWSPNDWSLNRNPEVVRENLSSKRLIFDREWRASHGNPRAVLDVVRQEVYPLSAWCFLREKSYVVPDDLYQEAARQWLYMNDQTKEVYRAEFKTVGLGRLDGAAAVLRRKLGLVEVTSSD